MSTDWDQQAICQFFEDYVIPVEMGRGGYLSFLPDLYRQHQDIAYLSKALNAVSMASLANRTSMSHLVVRARRSYGEALTLINAALSDEQLAKSDELLASLMLLTKYEHISGDKTTLWESHTAGQVQLIRLRGQDQFKSSTGLELYRLVLARHRLADLAYQRIPTLGSDMPSEGAYRNPHAARLADLMAGISALYGFLPKNGVSTLRRSSFPEGWVEKVLAIEEEIRQWRDTVPAFWGYRSMPPYDTSDNPGREDDLLYPKAVHVYSGFLQASSWNIIWCGRIHLFHAMLAYRSTLSPNEARRVALPTESSIKQELQTMADNVCNNVPFMLSEVDQTGALNTSRRGKAIGAYFLIWALHVAGSVEILSRSQQDWIAGRLLHIGHVVGIQQALVLREFRTARRRNIHRAPLSISRMSAWEQFQ
ncbi:hypothetical protein G7Y79_00047g082970 [Physcia stellaris]|nr:hypothetical protein G7Y79_00047g082970 [Physcia stellaris]